LHPLRCGGGIRHRVRGWDRRGARHTPHLTGGLGWNHRLRNPKENPVNAKFVWMYAVIGVLVFLGAMFLSLALND
jgi:hypothetical protein